MDCKHKPPCPSDTPTWNCGKRTEIEAAMFHLKLERDDGERLLRSMHLPIKPQSATERYNRDERDRLKRGPLFG